MPNRQVCEVVFQSRHCIILALPKSDDCGAIVVDEDDERWGNSNKDVVIDTRMKIDGIIIATSNTVIVATSRFR
jgi:hypothetical protein